jgi:hypothetical protein
MPPDVRKVSDFPIAVLFQCHISCDPFRVTIDRPARSGGVAPGYYMSRLRREEPATPNMKPPNPSFAADVARTFAQQPIMNLIGARLSLVEPGVVEISLPYRADLTQQHGYLHAGIVSTIADSACGYAA